VLLFGLVYVTWALHNFFARVARLVVADRSVSQRGQRRQTIKGGTYVECFQNSDFPLSPCRAVLRSASSLEEDVASCAGTHLVRLFVSKLRLTLAQRRMVYTVFSEKVRVFQV